MKTQNSSFQQMLKKYVLKDCHQNKHQKANTVFNKITDNKHLKNSTSYKVFNKSTQYNNNSINLTKEIINVIF